MREVTPEMVAYARNKMLAIRELFRAGTISIEEARTGVTAYMDWLGIHGDVILFLTRQDDAR